ncbi:arsenate reductase (glutaredoxin) [Corticibacter populi]|uniref:Arsenate reductase n=1 Tax=Corticibacter populi TaxID=1550736 RepID=A0A3M6QIQ0_9BURK|nr:arsenate reductase (glutaredoxin) [Corticibacter populi]RMX02953.1 arsenate reductase (glutaredoxin) [Corticibacter populi]RZS33370.1 arsenate reductase [Corticibacter populi]
MPASPAKAAHAATIYHNSRCSTSRKTLELLREHGYQPTIVEYLKTPLARAQIAALIEAAGLSVREAVRSKEPLYQELGLADADDAALLDAMAAHPVLLNRPFVTTAQGTRLARPVEKALEIMA